MAFEGRLTADVIAGELYGLVPERFTAVRNARAKEARGAGDKALADAIGSLRRPSVSAWLVNLLARNAPRELDEFLSLADQLRAAQVSLAGDELRRLSGQRHRVVAALVREALRLADRNDHPTGVAVEREVTSTLEAALADQEAADAVRSGRLMTALRYSGFGLDPGVVTQPVSHRMPAVQDTEGEQADRVVVVAVAERDAAVRSLADRRHQLVQAEAALRDAEEISRLATTDAEQLEGQLATARQAASEATEASEKARRAERMALRAAQEAECRASEAQQRLDSLGQEPDQ